jgi:hypothetical protein
MTRTPSGLLVLAVVGAAIGFGVVLGALDEAMWVTLPIGLVAGIALISLTLFIELGRQRRGRPGHHRGPSRPRHPQRAAVASEHESAAAPRGAEPHVRV